MEASRNQLASLLIEHIRALSNLFRQLDKRLGISPLIRALEKTRPQEFISIWDAPPISPGRFALVLVILLILSGLGLAFYYNPTAERAASSLARLHEEQPLGWLVHNVHRWSALLLFAFVILHALRAWLARAYRYPRDLSWWIGVTLLVLVVILGGTGYLLRWDIKAFSLMDLIISNFSSIPLIGDFLVALILGGSELDVVPLYRGYALHVWFLPLILVSILVIHIMIIWRQGLMERSGTWKRIQEWFPARSKLDLVPGMVLLIFLLIISVYTPHTEQVGPVDRSAWPHPDWLLIFYFLPFWFFKGDLRIIGALVVPIALLVFLVAAPRLGRRGAKFISIMALVGIAGVIWLFGQISYMGYQIPLQGCQACHRETLVGGAPQHLSEFQIRDPDWLVFHMQLPQESLFVPFELFDQDP